MTIWLRQSTASQEIPLGYFLDSTDGDSEETGLTISNTDIKLWKTGATTLANKNSGGATHISNGIYYATLDATDTNTLGPMVIFVHESGSLAIRLECLVLPTNVYDSLVLGTDYLDIETAAMAAGVVTAAAVATGAIDADAIAADAIGASEIANGAIDAATFAAGAIDASAIAAGAIDASAIAADAIGASEIATGAIAADAFAAGAIDAAATAADFLAEINAEVVDVFDTDVLSEPAQGAPPATPTKDEVLAYLYYALRNKGDSTSAIKRFYANDEATVIWSKALTDDDTTYAEAEGISG
jgi:hypothetical protein